MPTTFLFFFTFCATALVAGVAVYRFGRKGWLAVPLAALAVPNMLVMLKNGGAALRGVSPNYFSEVIFPLFLMGLPPALIGAAAAAAWVWAKRLRDDAAAKTNS